MTPTTSTALDDLLAMCGEVRTASPADAVDGVRPGLLARPADTAEVAAVLVVASRHGLRVVTWGAGTRMAWGAAPTAVDLVLDVSRMVGVLTHAAGDLVVTVQPGLPLADLQAALTQRQGGEISLAHTVTVLDASIRGLTVASLTGG